MSAGTQTPNQGSGTSGERRSVTAFLSTLPGIITALATLITAVAGAFFGGAQLAAHPTATVTVTVTAPAQPVTDSPQSPSAVGETSLPSPSVGASVAGGSTYLGALTPVDGSGYPPQYGTTNDTEQIGSKSYPDSVRFACGSSSYSGSATRVVYDVAGYKTLNAVVGIPSDATGAAGVTAIIKFLKDGTTTQLVPEVSVALDQSQTIRVDLQGASQLVIDCSANGLAVVLGSATLTPS